MLSVVPNLFAGVPAATLLAAPFQALPVLAPLSYPYTRTGDVVEIATEGLALPARNRRVPLTYRLAAEAPFWLITAGDPVTFVGVH